MNGKRSISNELSNKITFTMFVCCIIIVFRHSSGYKYFSISESAQMDLFVKCVIDYFKEGIFSVALPMFFFISALLFYRKFDYSLIIMKYKSRLKSIVVPYLSWNILSMFFMIIIERLPFITSNIESLERFEPTVRNVLEGVFLYKYQQVFWYMLEMIILIALCPIIYTLLKNKLIGLCTIIGIIVAYMMGLTLPGLTMRYLFFYILGAYISIHFWDILSITVRKEYSVMAIAGCLLIAGINTFCRLQPLLTLFSQVLFVVLLWISIDLFSQIKIQWWMKVYFFIFSLHRLLQQCVNKVLCLLLPDNSLYAFVNFFAGALITVIISCWAAYILIKYLPKLWNVLNGFRKVEI